MKTFFFSVNNANPLDFIPQPEIIPIRAESGTAAYNKIITMYPSSNDVTLIKESN